MFTVKFDIDGNVKGKHEREILTKRKRNCIMIIDRCRIFYN